MDKQPRIFLVFWFPRAGVGTEFGRASVLCKPRRWRVVTAFPRQRVGTRKMPLLADVGNQQA